MSGAFLALLWRITLVSTLAWLAIALLRRPLRRSGGAAAAYAAWLLWPTALLALALPAPVQPLRVLRIESVTQVVAGAAAPAPVASWASALVIAWCAGALLSLVAAWRRQRRFERGLLPLLPLSPAQRVCRAPAGRLSTPLLLGVWRARIVVPHDFRRVWPAAQRRLMLAHERVHLQRGDAAVNALLALAQALLWFHPLMPWVVRVLRIDQELACDAAVLRRRPQAARHYAHALARAQGLADVVPLACHWQHTHPLNRRIMELTRLQPGPLGRRIAFAALAASAASVTALAWAATSGTSLAPATARYKVALAITEQTDGAKGSEHRRVTLNAALALEAGRRAALQMTPRAVLDAPACEVALEVRPEGADTVSISMPKLCDAQLPRMPRLITKLGVPATIENGNDGPDGSSHSIRVQATVTPWPTGEAWPQEGATAKR